MAAAAAAVLAGAHDGRGSARPAADVCRHAAFGDRREFDARRAEVAWEHWLGSVPSAPVSADRGLDAGAHRAERFDAGLRAKVPAGGMIELADPLPTDWVGSTYVFVPASRLVRGALPPEGWIVVLTAWRSDAELRDAMDRLGERSVLVCGEALTSRLGVTAPETQVKIVSTRAVEHRRY